MNRDVYIGVGSNLGEPVRMCCEAAKRSAGIEEVEFMKSSSLYRTEPVGYHDQEWFVNAVFHLQTGLDPSGLMRSLQAVERDMGKQVEFRWGPRIIDLDILLYGDEVIDVPGLQVPHPRMHERRFVLEPMVEIAPGLLHPVLKKSMVELLSLSGDEQKVELIGGLEEVRR